MEIAQYQKKKENNIELLLLYQRLVNLEQSCLTKFLRFEKSELFMNFEKKYSVPQILNIRLDDFIYFLLLAIMETVFGVLPMDENNLMTVPYRQSLALFFLTTFLAMISPHWFRWLALLVFCLGYPGFIYLTINGYITLMPLNTGDPIYNYMGYLSLVPIFILLVLIYPLKEFIRNLAGALYSYVYALALTLILYLWPLYSLITELTSTGSISFNFITNNQSLITAFIILVITGFYFFVHNALFEPKLERLQELLLECFSRPELDTALEEVQASKIGQSSFIFSNFHCFTRSMSFIIYGITLGLQIFMYRKILQNSAEMTTLGVLMGYVILFLLFGAAYIYINIQAVIILPIVAVLSIGTAIPSLFYYSSSVQFKTYAYISLSGPFLAIFWSILKNITNKAIIFRTLSIIALYLTIFLPVIALVINSFGYLTSDTNIISVLNYVLLGIIVTTVVLLLVIFIVWEVKKHKLDNKVEEKSIVPLDYNYFQQGNPEYKYYQVKQEYGMGYLSNIDLRQIGYVSGLIFFIISELLSIHAVNLLATDYSSTIFYSPFVQKVIYSQFSNILVFYLFTHSYMANPEGPIVRNLFLVVFITIAVVTLALAFILSGSATTTLKIVGGFSVVMILILLALEAIKSAAQKIFGFVSAIIVVALWIFIVLPYVQLIPFISILVDQTYFGNFIYGCILGSVVLLIMMVGILTLVFNRLIDKFEEEKKYKFMMQDVIILFQEEGIESHDEELHIFYQSFMYRDKKYVFFLKRGFPLNLLQDPEDHITKLVTSDHYNLKKIPTKKDIAEEQQKKRSLLYACLTCCCGEDDEEIEEKLVKAKKVIDREELQSLLPKSVAEGLIKQNKDIVTLKKKKKWKNPAKVYSSKSLILKDLHTGPRYLGDEYILLKTNKNADLGIQIWHNIFDFASNKDEGEDMIISNDFHILIDIVRVNFTVNQIDQLFFECASSKWRNNSGMNLQDFALAVETIALKEYPDRGEEAKFYLLIYNFFYNLALYEQFNSLMIEKKISKRTTKAQIKGSPFQKSFNRFVTYNKEKKQKEETYMKKVNKFSSDKQIPLDALNERDIRIEQQDQEEKSPSCKRVIFDKVKALQNCCKKEQKKEDFERKLFVRPWSIICIDTLHIMEKKENDWDSVADVKEHPFRCTSNNLIMAAVKFIDLFTYVSVSVMNPQIGWIDGLKSSNLYLSYYVQVYLAVAVVAISVPFGIRGIMLIFEDRLGLTENRLPASFPHPMFFFTLFYKIMILSLFNIVSQTFLNTFNCNWTSGIQPYTLVDDPSIQCFSTSHSTMIIISLACLIGYYPLSSYAMPNFQFAEKSLDLKYRPSYLILYFQVNFIMLACKVLLSGSTSTTIQIINCSITIFVLLYLALSVAFLKPCFVLWFNWVELGVILIGVIVNTAGLALLLTKEWTLCVILASSLCGVVVIVMIIIIKKGYFSAKVGDEKEVNQEQYKQLELMWNSKQKKDKFLISFEDNSKNRGAPNVPLKDQSEEQNTQIHLREHK